MNKGIELIKKYEGCRLIAYKCSAGVWTIGWGSTRNETGGAWKAGDCITQQKADALLTRDLIEFKTAIENNDTLTKLSDDCKAALVCLAFNIGTGALLKSNLVKAIAARNLRDIMKNWDWYSAGGQVLLGLCRRRTEELSLFLSGWK